MVDSSNKVGKSVAADADFLTSHSGDIDLSAAVAASKSAGSDVMTAATAELYRNNLMRLESQELLSESKLALRLKPDHCSASKPVKWNHQVKEYLDDVQEAIQTLPSTTFSPDLALLPSTDKKDIQHSLVPLHSDKAVKHLQGKGNDEQTWEIEFKGELKTTLLGSAFTGGMLKSVANAHVTPTVDMAVLMPATMFHTKDYLNYRYFDKRNLLALHVAKTFQHSKKYRKKIGTVELSYYNGDARRVVVLLTPPPEKSSSVTKSKPKFRVRLILCTDGVQFPQVRLLPDRNNVRPIKGGENGDISLPPTPHYNNALAEDGMMNTIMQELKHDVFVNSTLMEDTLVLVKVWATQRGYLGGQDTIGSFGLQMLLLYLFRTKRISPRQSPLQAFVALMKLLRDTNFNGTPQDVVEVSNDTSSYIGYKGLRLNYGKHKLQRQILVMPPPKIDTSESQEKHDVMQLHSQHGCDVVFLDSTATLNFLAHMSASSMQDLQHEASTALDLVHGHGCTADFANSSSAAPSASFQSLFLTPCRFWRKFDAFVTIPLPTCFKDRAYCTFTTHAKGSHGSDITTEKLLWDTRCLDLGRYEALSRTAVELMIAALGDRATLVRPLTCGNGELINGSHGQVLPLGGGDPSLNDANQTRTWSPRTPAHDEQEKQGQQMPFLSCKFGSNHIVNCPLAWNKGSAGGIVLGIKIYTDTAARLVDRGPPADQKDSTATKEFKAFWGRKAELRRFKDGAIVHAVVWDGKDETQKMVTFQSSEATNSIVEQIVDYTYQTHLANVTAATVKNKKKIQNLDSKGSSTITFMNRHMLGLVESYHNVGSSSSEPTHKSSLELHKGLMKAYDNLVTFLLRRTKDDQKDRLGGIPMAIDLAEPLSPALRYSAVFPPCQHPMLLQSSVNNTENKVPGAVDFDPVDVQLRLKRCGNWPGDVNAMGAAKCALLVLIANGLEKELGAAIKCEVYPTHMIIGFEGYFFRIYIRPDEELRLLKAVKNPTVEAIKWKRELERRHIVAASHHALVHGVHTRHPSAGLTVRLAKRWCASHMISAQILPHEALELIVAKVYSNPMPFGVPSSAFGSGFMRFLYILWSHDWIRQPLVVDPQGHLTIEDYQQIESDFNLARGGDSGQCKGPPMFIISPSDRRDGEATQKGQRGGVFIPTFTQSNPENVVLARAVALAKKSYFYLLSQMTSTCIISEPKSQALSFGAVFLESASSLKSYSVLLRVDDEIIIDDNCSSTKGYFGSSALQKAMADTPLESPFTKCIINKFHGPKILRRKKLFKNLRDSDSNNYILSEWKPVDRLVESFREKFGNLAVFFHNDLTPEVIGMIWRPQSLQGQPFSALNSEYKRPIEHVWQSDSLVVTNAHDVLADMKAMSEDVIADMKIMDNESILPKDRPLQESTKGKRQKTLDNVEKGNNPSEESSDEESTSF